MSIERKKAQPKPIVKSEPKKRVVAEETPIVVEETKPKVVAKQPIKPEVKTEAEETVKVKKAENKYERIFVEAKAEEKAKIAERVKNGELKYAFYATDGDKGYHHYLVIKKQK